MPQRAIGKEALHTIDLALPQQGGHEIDEQAHTRRAPLARAIQEVDRRSALHLPVLQHGHQSTGGDVIARGQFGEAAHAFAIQYGVQQDLTAVSGELLTIIEN